MLTYLRAISCDKRVAQWLVNVCAAHVVRLELRADEVSPFVHGEDGAFGKVEQLTISWPTEDFLNNTGALPLLKQFSVAHFDNVELRNVSILNFLKKFSTTLEVLDLGPDFKFQILQRPRMER